ncbi:3-keto-5-aminohexanoate cleavage protein [Bosea sp. (in: a-proteobacteria)]|jgi:3-keto-5-aminohexanoate cleavage enzyme|uniref:3-keto-5-aminohexanoate cleavage protein n=1 Tax=Bosea sp. (in: a-proteobacteria) TaxID=1871050 RepID=UPI003F7117B1
MTTSAQSPAPLLIAVAPTGARRGKADHPALPVTSSEIAAEAVACRAAGAAMLHLHVRDAQGAHSIDPERYREASAAVRSVCADIVIQITTEAVGRYTPEEQADCIRRLRPEAVSIAIREICPPGSDERQAEALFGFMAAERIAPQIILYDTADIAHFLNLRRRGVLCEADRVLYVLGRYSPGQRSGPADLIPFLNAAEGEALNWSLCAFGPLERACALTAAGLGGHVRVGFENNLWLPDGSVAPGNAALVAGIAAAAGDMGRKVADPHEARAILGCRNS